MTSTSVGRALADPDRRVVENAIPLATARVHGKAMLEIARSGADRASFLAAIAIGSGEVDDDSVAGAFTALLAEAHSDPWMRKAVLSAEPAVGADVLAAVIGLRPGADLAPLAREFTAETAARGDLDGIARITGALGEAGPGTGAAMVEGLSEGLRRSSLRTKTLAAFLGAPPAALAPGTLERIASVLASARTVVLDGSAPTGDRIAALRLVGQRGSDEAFDVVARLLNDSEPPDLQAAACRVLSRFDRKKVAEFLFNRWKALGPSPRHEALNILTSREDTGLLLMRRMRDGEISKSLMPAFPRWRFARSGNTEVKALAMELFGTVNADRAKVIADYAAALATHEGDPSRGRAVFQKAACATCHRIGELGVDVGPGISDVRIKPPEALLTDILDPNRMVEERWAAYTVTTRNGRTLAGIITAESDAAVEITMPGGWTETISRDEVEGLRTTGLSLMPVGLEGAVSPAEMADLIAFLKAR